MVSAYKQLLWVPYTPSEDMSQDQQVFPCKWRTPLLWHCRSCFFWLFTFLLTTAFNNKQNFVSLNPDLYPGVLYLSHGSDSFRKHYTSIITSKGKERKWTNFYFTLRFPFVLLFCSLSKHCHCFWHPFVHSANLEINNLSHKKHREFKRALSHMMCVWHVTRTCEWQVKDVQGEIVWA